MDQNKGRSDLDGRRATIRELARAAGVSVSTASKALNAQGRMAPETRDRVRQIAQEIGFRPDAVARALVGKRSFTLGLITNDTYGRFTLPVATGLASAMASKGVSVFLCALDDDPALVRLSIEAMEDKRVDGLVIAGKRIDRAPPFERRRLAMPVVYANAATPPDGVGFVPDDEAGGALAVRHLLSLGRRRLAHISGPEAFAAVTLRATGLRQVLAEAGLTPYGRSLHGQWSEAFGYECGLFLRERLGTEHYPDAVFCGNDQIARGLIDALHMQKIRVPEDIAVVGYDNWEIFASATRPPLTTVDMALTRLGECAGLTLLDLIAGKPIDPGLRKLPCHLVVRQSCGGFQNKVDITS